jgi:hypothetical protein
LTFYPVKDELGQVQLVAIAFSDVTKRRCAEMKLGKLRDKFLAVALSSHNPLDNEFADLSVRTLQLVRRSTELLHASMTLRRNTLEMRIEAGWGRLALFLSGTRHQEFLSRPVQSAAEPGAPPHPTPDLPMRANCPPAVQVQENEKCSVSWPMANPIKKLDRFLISAQERWNVTGLALCSNWTFTRRLPWCATPSETKSSKREPHVFPRRINRQTTCGCSDFSCRRRGHLLGGQYFFSHDAHETLMRELPGSHGRLQRSGCPLQPACVTEVARFVKKPCRTPKDVCGPKLSSTGVVRYLAEISMSFLILTFYSHARRNRQLVDCNS